MKKSVYLDSTTLRGILFPDNRMLETDKLFYDEHIDIYAESLFNTRLHYFDHERFKDSDDIADQYAPVVVKLIITTPDRNGLWLSYEQDKQKISIPGGHVSREDVEFVREELGNTQNGLLILQEALSREIYEEFYGDEVGYDMYDTNKQLLCNNAELGTSPLTSIMSAVYSRFKTSHRIHPINDLYYLYKGRERLCSRSLTFYYVIECDCDRMSPVHAYPKDFIWLSKYEFQLSCRKNTPLDMIPIFGEPLVPINRDIRYSSEYRPILEIIFNTPELF